MDLLIKLFSTILTIIDGIIVPLIFAVAFLVFIWGVFQYFIAGGGNEEKRKEGKNFILYGLIGFFVMISVWGLVNVLVGTFGFGGKARPALPSFGGSGNAGSFEGSGNDDEDKGEAGSTCGGSRQCRGNTVCVMNGTTGEGTCRAI